METKVNNKQFVQVYKSTDTVPCEAWFAPDNAEVAYPYTADKPDANLKMPKYDWINRRWFETNETTTGQQLSEIKNQVKELSDKVANGELSQDAINEQISTLVDLVSANAAAIQSEEPDAKSSKGSGK